MNQLSLEKRVLILKSLVNGNSIRFASDLAEASPNTVTKLLVDVGGACSAYQDKVFRNLKFKRVECDELWAFVGCKEKNATPEKKAKGHGDAWTWVALDPDTKLVPCWLVGTRDAECAHRFMSDLASRLGRRVQLTTDKYKPYLKAVETAFGDKIDYATLTKKMGEQMNAAFVSGCPDYRHISTSLVERNNLTMRMKMRRFTRKTNAFSKKFENLEHAVALHFMHYNFCRIHLTLRTTPAVEAGVTDHVWEMSEVVDLID